MADEKLTWDLQFDMTGNGLRQAHGQMETLSASVAKGQRMIASFEQGAGKLSVTLGETGSAASRAGAGMGALTTVLGGVVAGLAAVAAGAVAGVKALDAFGDTAIKAFGERASTMRAYTTLLGSVTEAQKEFSKAQALSQKTDLTSSATEAAQKRLMVAGFRGGALDAALLAGADIASMSADKNLSLDAFTRGVSKVRGAGKLQADVLSNEFETAGLSRALIQQEIGKILGLKDTDAIQKAISGGKVSSEVGITAVQQAVLKQMNTSKLGDFAVSSAGSLTSLISNRDEAVQNLLKSFDPDADLPAMAVYKQSLKEQGEILSVTGKRGEDLTITMEHMANTALNLKSTWTEFSSGFLDSFAEGYAAIMREIKTDQPAFERTGLAAKDLGQTLGKVTSSVAYLVEGLTQLEKPIYTIGYLINEVAASYSMLTKGHAIDATTNMLGAYRHAFMEGVAGAAGADADVARKNVQRDIDNFGAAPGEGGRGGGTLGALGLLQIDGPTKAKGASGGGAGGSGGGRGGGAGAGFQIGYHADYSGLGGMTLPTVGQSPMSVGGMSYTRTQMTGVSAGVRERDPIVKQQIDNVEIVIDGSDMTSDEIAEKVADVLRQVGRYARNPSPEIS